MVKYNYVGANDANFEDEEEYDNDRELHKNIKPENVFNNPVSAFLATLSSIFFWTVYFLAKAIIVLAGICIIIAFIFPLKCIGFFNRLLDQDRIEQKFREEL